MKKLFSKELLIGLCVVITLLILFFGIDYLKGINVFHTSNYYFVSYTNVNGLAQSAPVTVNGFKVGLVREIQYEYDNPGHVLVELSLDKELKVPNGTKAVLVTDMLGTSSIELEMATPSSAEDIHAVGDRLIGVNAKGLMDNLSGDMLPRVAEILPHVDSLVVALTQVAASPAFTSSLQRLDGVMANLEKSTERLTAVMNTMPAIVASASATMENVNGFSDNLLRISNDLNDVAAKVNAAPIDSTLAHLNAISRNLDELLASVNSDQSTVGLLLRDPALYNNLNNSAAHLDSILVDLQRTPKRYIPSIKVF